MSSSSDCERSMAPDEEPRGSRLAHEDSDLLAERRRCLADCFRRLAGNLEAAVGAEHSSDLATRISYMMHHFADVYPGPNDEMLRRRPRLTPRPALANAMILRELLLWISESAAYEPTSPERPPTIMAAVEMVLAEGEVMSSRAIQQRVEAIRGHPIASVGTALHLLKQRGRADHVRRGMWQCHTVSEDRPALPDNSIAQDAPAGRNIEN